MSGAARNTNALCLPVSLRHKLQCAGLRTTHHLQGLSSTQLADGELASPGNYGLAKLSHPSMLGVPVHCTQLYSPKLMQKA